MTHPRFFGYGSLVNLATHAFPDPTPASLIGWRRVWRHARTRPVAFLSVERCETTTLHGITAQVPNADWAALDLREHAYLRRDVTAQFDHDTAIYEANPVHTASPNTNHPILLSYLDVVISGYTSLMGEAGPAHFFETTHGWGPVLDDRETPIYPRAQSVSPKTRNTVDAALAALSVAVQPPEHARLLLQTIATDVAPVAPHDAVGDDKCKQTE